MFIIGEDYDNISTKAKQLKVMTKSGLISVQNHTWSHCVLSLQSVEDLKKQIDKCNAIIKKLTNTQPYVLCYPFGDYNDNVINSVKVYMQYCVTTKYGKYIDGQSMYEIKRIRISRFTSYNGFAYEVE